MASNSENYSQSKQILDYLQSGNALTPLEALRKFNCLRLGGAYLRFTTERLCH
ncbi:helix-turn-helix domain-containing protein [Snodgrassella alvi]|uniref:helix-turn-helix domain-containing protein n=1 Tax=Snodgrassella alvi TaxID=1196083 RepID=UPI003CC820AE